MKNIITSTFNRGSDASLATIAQRIVTGIKSNAQFQSLSEPITNLEKALGEYVTALGNTGTGDRVMIAVKDAKRAVLRALLTELAVTVSQISKGDRALLLSSGFDITKEQRERAAKKPLITVVDLGTQGEVSTHTSRVRGARAYSHQYTTDPITVDSVWKSETTKSNRHSFKGLPLGMKLWFRVVVLEKDGSSTFLQPVPGIV